MPYSGSAAGVATRKFFMPIRQRKSGLIRRDAGTRPPHSAAASEAAFADGVTRLPTFREELQRPGRAIDAPGTTKQAAEIGGAIKPL